MSGIRKTLLVMISVVATGVAVSDANQPPLRKPAGGLNVATPFDRYVPQGGYRRTISVLRLRREAAVNGAALRQRHAVGARAIPVVLVEFQDKSFPDVFGPDPRAGVQKMLFGDLNAANPQQTMSQYYHDMSNELWSLTGEVFGPYKLPGKESDYLDAQATTGPNTSRFLRDVVTAADNAGIPWEKFDNDAPSPTEENDGRVDTLVIIQPQYGAECDGVPGTHIWSHSFSFTQMFGQAFTTGRIRKHRDGSPYGDPNNPEHIVIDDYTVQPALGCDVDENGKRKPTTIGVFCHEYGHALGLPDLYDRTPQGNPDSQGIGKWCIMAGGEWGGDPVADDPALPVSMSAWCKHYLGWSNEITKVGALTVEPVERANKMLRFDVSGTNGDEYFLIEWRSKGAGDATKINWDAELPDSGFAVWHIDERVGDPTTNDSWPFAQLDQGQNDAPSTQPNHDHSLVSLVQADGKMTLEQVVTDANGRVIQVAKGELFSGPPGLQADVPFGKGSRTHADAVTGLVLKDIDLQAGHVTIEAGPAVIPSVAAVPVHGIQPDGAHIRAAAATQPGADMALMVDPRLFEDVAKLRDAGSTAVSVEARVNAEARHPTLSVTNLSLPSTRPSLAEDAASRFSGELAHLTNTGVKLRASATTRSLKGGTEVVLRQVETVDHTELPIWGAKAYAFYQADLRKMVAASSGTTAPSVKLTDKERHSLNKLSEAEATTIALAQLGVGGLRKVRAVEQMILIDPISHEGQLVYRVDLKVGKSLEDVHVFVHEATKSVIDIQ